MRVISLNAWGGAMFEPLSAWLRTCDADVLCLQEVTHTPGLHGWTRFEDGERTLPQRANLFDDVAAALPDHHGVFVASDAGPVWDERGARHHQDFGLALFVHNRFPIIGQHAAFVHGAFVDHDEWAIEQRPRVAQAVRLVDRAAGRTVAVVHLHGLRDPAGKADTPDRRRQAERLAAVVDTIREPDDVVVVAGDLNLLPDSETFDVLGAHGLVDLVGAADTRTSRYAKPVRHASYLLVSDPGLVQSFDIPARPEVSDHRYLVLDL
ncbi:MAG: endonuclease/exonuclease/phosphatase family protein [Actinomycetota bacterium]